MPYKDPDKQQREYQRVWQASRRQKWLDENGPCVQCGSRENLEVDHIDPFTKVSHRIWSWSEVRRAQELAKCQVLCKTCHLKKTISVYPKWEHGTEKGYRTCRCVDCRAANAERVREWRRRIA